MASELILDLEASIHGTQFKRLNNMHSDKVSARHSYIKNQMIIPYVKN